ncbi:hypothetical protein [Paenibacillus sp. YPG26]|uniref:hypothetical protein n=1 Tax=Paenibacillus sp. YPG26 TaxID=2878915 RepID=UPI00203B2D7C|nr:hypothetical protein [Paenibacillus sp. YPG26]USB34697.1 hypothetical protein LDO05_08070 [Paenibacillus sp. YPG26]
MAYQVTYKDKDNNSDHKKTFTSFAAAEQEAKELDADGHSDVVLESPRRKAGLPNLVGIMLKSLGVLILVGGVLVGMFTGRDSANGFDLIIAMEWWVLAVMSAAFFYGMGEVVNLLDRLVKKLNT